jgi:hypothetical protein
MMVSIVAMAELRAIDQTADVAVQADVARSNLLASTSAASSSSDRGATISG